MRSAYREREREGKEYLYACMCMHLGNTYTHINTGYIHRHIQRHNIHRHIQRALALQHTGGIHAHIVSYTYT